MMKLSPPHRCPHYTRYNGPNRPAEQASGARLRPLLRRYKYRLLSGTRTHRLFYRRYRHHSFPLCDEVREERLAVDEEKKQRRHCGERDRPKQRTYFVRDARLHVRGARAGLIGSRLAKKMLETVDVPAAW